MRISASTKVRAEKARELFAQNGNLSKTARELGIHRSTLDRWQKEGLLDEPVISDEESPDLSLDFLVTKAFGVIDTALDGEKVTAAQIRAALDVIKGSNALRSQAVAEKAQQSLAELIAQESDESD